LDQWLANFTQEIQHLLGYSPTTAKAYASDIRQFLRYVAKHRGTSVSPEAVQPEDVLGFLKAEAAAGRRRATLHRRVASLRVMERYLWLTEKIKHTFMPAEEQMLDALQGSAASHTTGCLTAEELQRLWQTLLASPKRQARRDLALMALMVEWGFPVGTLLKLQVQHVDLQARELWTPLVSGTLERWTLDHAYEPLWRYVMHGRADLGVTGQTHSLFVSQQNRGLSRQSVWHALRAWGKEAELHKVLNPRLLRTTAAYRMMLRGIPAQTIGMAMGHSNPLSTTVLLHRLEQQCGHIETLDLPRVPSEDDTRHS